jgi:hypothetical protein
MRLSARRCSRADRTRRRYRRAWECVSVQPHPLKGSDQQGCGTDIARKMACDIPVDVRHPAFDTSSRVACLHQFSDRLDLPLASFESNVVEIPDHHGQSRLAIGAKFLEPENPSRLYVHSGVSRRSKCAMKSSAAGDSRAFPSPTSGEESAARSKVRNQVGLGNFQGCGRRRIPRAHRASPLPPRRAERGAGSITFIVADRQRYVCN